MNQPENIMASKPLPSIEEDLSQMLLIRQFEKLLLELFQQGKLHGTTHTCLGQEYIPVAIMPLLRDEDYIFSNHRGHGHYLAKFHDPEGLLSEVLGRKGAICHGVGGSQHLRRNHFFSTGVQGESLPVACGVAWQLKREGKGGLAVAFIGDGTWGEGAVYEALNLASLYSVPLLVVVENNGIAQTTPTAMGMAGTIRDRALAFGCRHHLISIHAPDAIRTLLSPVLAALRHDMRPVVVEFATRRLGPHSKGDDTRSAAELSSLRQLDWEPACQASHPELYARLSTQVQAQLASLLADIESRPPSDWK